MTKKLILISLFVTACASQPQVFVAKSNSNQSKVAAKKVDAPRLTPKMLREVDRKVASDVQSASQLKIKDQKPQVQAENQMYAEVLASYDSNDFARFDKASELFLKMYPQSVHADNAVYLRGMAALQKENFGEALKHFDRVIKEYPLGHKVVSSMYAKAMTYKKMHLPEEAKNMFQETKLKYPGSLEASRAKLQLQMIEKGIAQ